MISLTQIPHADIVCEEAASLYSGSEVHVVDNAVEEAAVVAGSIIIRIVVAILSLCSIFLLCKILADRFSIIPSPSYCRAGIKVGIFLLRLAHVLLPMLLGSSCSSSARKSRASTETTATWCCAALLVSPFVPILLLIPHQQPVPPSVAT